MGFSQAAACEPVLISTSGPADYNAISCIFRRPADFPVCLNIRNEAHKVTDTPLTGGSVDRRHHYNNNQRAPQWTADRFKTDWKDKDLIPLKYIYIYINIERKKNTYAAFTRYIKSAFISNYFLVIQWIFLHSSDISLNWISIHQNIVSTSFYEFVWGSNHPAYHECFKSFVGCPCNTTAHLIQLKGRCSQTATYCNYMRCDVELE